VDHRADIWAFGVALFEMVTRQKLFSGDDLTEIVASIVKEQPDLSVAPREVPRVLEACLRKDRHQRLQAIGIGA
jgi:eukaryotic-like serine/threonine-protein kinase